MTSGTGKRKYTFEEIEQMRRAVRVLNPAMVTFGPDRSRDYAAHDRTIELQLRTYIENEIDPEPLIEKANQVERERIECQRQYLEITQKRFAEKEDAPSIFSPRRWFGSPSNDKPEAQ